MKHHGKTNFYQNGNETCLLTTTAQGKIRVQESYSMPEGSKQSLQTDSIMKLHHVSSLLEGLFFSWCSLEKPQLIFTSFTTLRDSALLNAMRAWIISVGICMKS